MKKGLTFLAAAALMTAVTSCNKNEEMTAAADGVSFSLKFEAEATPQSRATFEDLNGVWELDDIVYIVLTDTEGTPYGPYESHPSEAAALATFNVEINNIQAEKQIKTVTAYHYGNMSGDVRHSAGAITYAINPANGELSYLAVSNKTLEENFTVEADAELDITGHLDFQQQLARIDIETDIQNIAEITLDFTGGQPFYTAGTLNIDGDANTPTTADAPQYIKITGSKAKYQIGVIPATFAENQTMNVTVVTSDNKAYTKEVNVTAFEKAKRYTLSLNQLEMTEATAISADSFQPIVDDPDGHFVLTKDLELDNIPHLEGFKGTLDGNGHSIDITSAGMSDTQYGGIFSTTEDNAAVTNLTVIAGDRSAEIEEGGVIVGRVSNGTLTLDNVHVTGNITAERQNVGDKHLFVGGLVGCVPNGAFIHVTNSSFNGNITVEQYLVDIPKNSYVGGIVGAVESGYDSFETSSDYKGGEAGSGSYIINCTYTGSLTNTANLGAYTPEIYTGGIAGRCTGLIKDCSVTDVLISATIGDDGSGRQAKPILGNDWYENINNDNNLYKNVSVNRGVNRTGTYQGSKAASSDKPYYSDEAEQ